MAASTQPSHSLSGWHRLPSWTRPSLQGRPGCTVLKTLPRDPVVQTRGQASRETDTEQVSRLERNISFIRSQHSQTLVQLHAEMEKLRRENRELNFKLVMCRCGQKSDRSSHSRNLQLRKFHSLHESDAADTSEEDELRPFLLEQELPESGKTLWDKRQQNARLKKTTEWEMEGCLGQADVDSEKGGANGWGTDLADKRRNPTLSECREIITHLQTTIQRQNHELLQLKADLQDMLYSDKWTPDAYLLARAYVPETTPQERVNLPPVTVRKESKFLNDKTYQRLQSNMHLPALQPRPSVVTERHRKSKIMASQRAKFFSLHHCRNEHVGYR